MNTETKPATDEEIAKLRERLGIPGMRRWIEISVWDARRVLAAYGTERTRAEKAEADCDAWCKSYDEQGKVLNAIRTERDALAAQLAEARQQITAERERAEKAEAGRARANHHADAWRSIASAKMEQLAEAHQQIAALREALDELLKDMVIAQVNMRKATRYDLNWEGCAEAIQPRVDKARAALAQTEGDEG